MADGRSQAAKAKPNPRIRHNTINYRGFNWSVTGHSHTLVTLLVHQNPLARASCGTMLKALSFRSKPIPTHPSCEG